jgi:ferredoxin/flavodoxin---NADP+ reductase
VFDVVLAQRGATPLMWKQWQTTDAAELRRGAETGRPRVKFVDTAEKLATAR